MYRQEIIDKVNAIIGEKADIAPEYIEPDDYYDEIGMSFDQLIELSVKMEDEFAIDITGTDLLHFNTMQDMYDIIEKKIIDTLGFQVY